MPSEELLTLDRLTPCYCCSGPAPLGSKTDRLGSVVSPVLWRACDTCTKAVTLVERARSIAAVQCTPEEQAEIEAAGYRRIAQELQYAIGMFALVRHDANPLGPPGVPWGHVPDAGQRMVRAAREIAARAAHEARVGPHPSGLPCRTCGSVTSQAHYITPQTRPMPEARLRGTPMPGPQYDRLERYPETNAWGTDARYGAPVCGPCRTVINRALRLWHEAAAQGTTESLVTGYGSASEMVGDYLAADCWGLDQPTPAGSELARRTHWTAAHTLMEYGTAWPWPGRWAYIPAQWRTSARELADHLGQMAGRSVTGERFTRNEPGPDVEVTRPDGTVYKLRYSITTSAAPAPFAAAVSRVAADHRAWRDGRLRPAPVAAEEPARA
ncbi:hypothetical protein [Streptomyces hydrogenans]|uniref:hypothetical protein n=1 Tax=Streptomyces hydrogenans TaxID=1873719 RepID=UPI0038222343